MPNARTGYVSADAVLKQPPILSHARTGYVAADIVIAQTKLLKVTKVPDAASVDKGQTIGWTITVQNISTVVTAIAVTLYDPLPAGTGINWSISPAYAGPGTCAISGAPPTQVLNGAFGNLVPLASVSFHITSPT